MTELFGTSFVSSIRGAPCTSWPQLAASAFKGTKAVNTAARNLTFMSSPVVDGLRRSGNACRVSVIRRYSRCFEREACFGGDVLPGLRGLSQVLKPFA